MNDRTTADKASSIAAEFSVPAAELFAAWAVPMAVCEASERPAHLISGARVGPNGETTLEPPIIAIGDCQPAAHVIDSATSGEATMRCILASARQFSRFWLAWASTSLARPTGTPTDSATRPTLTRSCQRLARPASGPDAR